VKTCRYATDNTTEISFAVKTSFQATVFFENTNLDKKHVMATPVVLKLGSIESLGIDGTVSGIRRRSSDLSNPFLLSVVLGTNGVRQTLGKLRNGSECL